MLLTIALASLMSACGDSPTTPTPPAPTPPATLSISCPSAVSAQSADGAAIPVTFAAPTVTGGTAPVSTTCTPASGASFAVGTTTSTCTARDSASPAQTASCTVPVTVSKTPRLTVTKFLAVGDSITSGTPSTCRATLLDAFSWRRYLATLPRRLDQPGSYPSTLRTLLASRYTAQTFQVDNAGVPGQTTEEGVDTIRQDLLVSRPQVLLLQEGANDANQGEPPFTIAANLRDMAKFGREAGAQVFIGTLLPQRPEPLVAGCLSRGYGAANIASINAAIRAMATAEGLVLVDLHAAFGGVPGDLIGVDGLHPSPAGYEKIAGTFFDTIRQRLEN